MAGLAALSPWLPKLSLLPGELCVLEGGTPPTTARLAAESVVSLSPCCPETCVEAFTVVVLRGERVRREEKREKDRGKEGRGD